MGGWRWAAVQEKQNVRETTLRVQGHRRIKGQRRLGVRAPCVPPPRQDINVNSFVGVGDSKHEGSGSATEKRGNRKMEKKKLNYNSGTTKMLRVLTPPLRLRKRRKPGTHMRDTRRRRRAVQKSRISGRTATATQSAHNRWRCGA